MKTLLTISVLLIAGIVSAQENNYSDLLKRYKDSKIKKLNPQDFKSYYDMRRYPTTTPQFSVPSAPPSAKLLTTLSNGNKVYALPQDNMPCVVPNVTQTMPNAGNSNQLRHYPEPGSIPNTGRTMIIPIKKTTKSVTAQPQSPENQ